MMYNYIFFSALIVFSCLTFAYLFRSILGPNFFDRILGINNISTISILMICIISVLHEESYIIDIALIYAMLGFITTIIVCKSYLRSRNKERGRDFENIKLKGNDDGNN